MNRNSGNKKKTKNVWSKDIAKDNEESSKTEFHDVKRKDVSRSPSPVEILSPMKVPKVYTHTPTVKEPSKPHPSQDESEEDLDDNYAPKAKSKSSSPLPLYTKPIIPSGFDRDEHPLTTNPFPIRGKTLF